jgi:hypothetical protein
MSMPSLRLGSWTMIIRGAFVLLRHLKDVRLRRTWLGCGHWLLGRCGFAAGGLLRCTLAPGERPPVVVERLYHCWDSTA